jgi:hypothetical protein
MTTALTIVGVTQDPATVGVCPPSRYGIPPNLTTPSDVAWANAILANPASSAPNQARARQLLANPRAPP